MIKDVYYQRGFPDPVLEDDLVLSLVRPFVPKAEKVTSIDESGGEARTYGIDGDVILKVQRPQQLRLSTSLAREVFFLKELEKFDSSISVPRVLGYGKEGTLEYTVMTRMPGKALRHSDLTDTQRKDFYFELGKTLRKIHGINCALFHESGLYPDIDTPQEIKDRFKARFERVLGWLQNNSNNNISQKDAESATSQALAILENVPNAEILTPLHSNPGPEHVFVNENGSFSGLIDFGDSYISHPICDFRSTHVRDRTLVLAGYESEGEICGNFKELWNAAYALDSLIDVLRNKR